MPAKVPIRGEFKSPFFFSPDTIYESEENQKMKEFKGKQITEEIIIDVNIQLVPA